MLLVNGDFYQFSLIFCCLVADRETANHSAAGDRPRGGVIFIDEKTISPADIGGPVRALTGLAKEAGNWKLELDEPVVFLRR
jgi:hypothetical protein